MAGATVEKIAGARRSRLQRIDDGIAADEQKLQAARAKFVELAETEADAVREAKRKDPVGSPYTLNSAAQLARSEAAKLDTTISGLERGLKALREQRVEAVGEQATRELRERTDEARDLLQKERDARLAAGKAFAL